MEHAIERSIETGEPLPGFLDVTPGIRILNIHYDPRVISRTALLETIDAAEQTLQRMPDIHVASRVVHLPLSWEDPETKVAIRKYMHACQPDSE